MRWTTAGGLILTLAIAGLAVGVSESGRYVPGGTSALPGTQSSCQTCHVSASPTYADLNPFGRQVGDNLTGGVPDWRKLYNLDADKDGYTNGDELGDPAGRWRAGQRDPSIEMSNPGDPNSKPSRVAAI